MSVSGIVRPRSRPETCSRLGGLRVKDKTVLGTGGGGGGAVDVGVKNGRDKEGVETVQKGVTEYPVSVGHNRVDLGSVSGETGSGERHIVTPSKKGIWSRRSD